MKNKTIIVNAGDFARYLKMRRIANALARKADQLKESFALPEACKANAGDYVIHDGNKQPIGKLTIAHRDGYEVKPGWTARVS